MFQNRKTKNQHTRLMILFWKVSIALSQLKKFQDCQFQGKISRVCSLYKYLKVFLTQRWQNFSVVVMTAITVKENHVNHCMHTKFCLQLHLLQPSQVRLWHLSSVSPWTLFPGGRLKHVRFCKSTSILDTAPRSQFSFLISLINTSSIPLPLH